jgi:hypothetical protein
VAAPRAAAKMMAVRRRRVLRVLVTGRAFRVGRRPGQGAELLPSAGLRAGG